MALPGLCSLAAVPETHIFASVPNCGIRILLTRADMDAIDMNDSLKAGTARHKGLLLWLVLAAISTGCFGNGPEAEARAHLVDVLRDSAGAATNPQVAFIDDVGDKHPHGQHLYVQLDTSAFSNLPDSAFVLRAQEIARLSMRHYENATNLDSITVVSLESLNPGVARIHHRHTFAVVELRPVP